MDICKIRQYYLNALFIDTLQVNNLQAFTCICIAFFKHFIQFIKPYWFKKNTCKTLNGIGRIIIDKEKPLNTEIQKKLPYFEGKHSNTTTLYKLTNYLTEKQ